MKTKLLIILIILGTLFVSCSTSKMVPKALPQKDTLAILTPQQIKNMENKEDYYVNNNFETNKFSHTRDTASQAKISNVFVETPLSAVLQDLASQTKTNLVYDNATEGSISMSLNKVPLEKALDQILYPGGYKYRYVPEGNYYFIGKSLPENTSFDQLTITKTIKTNRGADKIISQISSYFQPFIKADGQVITITASPDVVNRLERDISLIDRGRRQIEISARFVVVEWEKGVNLGAQWSNINFSALGLADIIKGGATGFAANFTSALSSVLTANGYDTNVKSVAEPRITVEDGEKGEVSATEEHTIPILSGGGLAYSYYTTKEISVGIKMNVQPSITRDGQVRLNLKQEVSDIVGESEFKQQGGASQMIPIVARRITETILKVRNGETVAIGGLINNVDQTKKSGLPFFRKIPVAGRAFGNKNQKSKQSELVVFITPRVIYETPPPVLY